MASTELSMSTSSPGPGSPLGFETTPRPRKKLSFKEPEIFNYLKMRKPSMRPKMLHAQNSVDLSFDENPFEEENEDLDELEVKDARISSSTFYFKKIRYFIKEQQISMSRIIEIWSM